MAELADATDLKSVGYLNREGSSPSLSINKNNSHKSCNIKHNKLFKTSFVIILPNYFLRLRDNDALLEGASSNKRNI